MRKLVASSSIVAVLALACSACGNNDPKSASPEQPASSTSPSGSPFPLGAAKAAAGEALLTIEDMPPGWSTSKDDSTDDDSGQFEEQLGKCLHAPPSLFSDDGTDRTHQDSLDFDSPDGNTTISESVSVGTLANQKQGFSILRQDNAMDCLTTTFDAYAKDQFAKNDDPALKDATLGDVQVGQLSAGRFGDDSLAMRATIPVSASGISITVYVDIIYVRSQNAVANLTFEGVGTPVDPQTSAQFTRLATKKLTGVTYPRA